MSAWVCGPSGFVVSAEQSKADRALAVLNYRKWMEANRYVLSGKKVQILGAVLAYVERNLVGYGFLSRTNKYRFYTCFAILSKAHWQDSLFAYVTIQEMQSITDHTSALVQDTLPLANELYHYSTVALQHQLTVIAWGAVLLALALAVLGSQFIASLILVAALVVLTQPSFGQLYVALRLGRGVAMAHANEALTFHTTQVGDGMDADLQAISHIATLSKRKLVNLALSALVHEPPTTNPTHTDAQPPPYA